MSVVVLEGAAAGDQRWREAFTNAANVLAQTPGGHRYVNADFAATQPWVAYPSEEEGAAARLFQTLGMDYQRTPTAEMLPPPPVSAPPQPVSGPPQLPWAPQPWAMASQPVSGAPVSPVSPVSPVAAPATFAAPDPLDSSGDRRIAPTERAPRSRTGPWVGSIVLTAVLAGGAGLLAGNALGGAEPTTKPSASATPPYDVAQYKSNKSKFDGDLLPLAEPWLSEVGECAADTDAGGPKLPKDEKRHVFCQYGIVFVNFALYESPAKKDAARANRKALGIAGSALAPGMREAMRTIGGVSKTPGSYIEYAGNPGDGRVMCGIWWDRDDSVAAIYFETPCQAGIAGNWSVLRDLWRRNS
ncbi:hypothetical protein [Micromonospora inositola]|uniref:hypothetical protein n=1 Tax=Micromonospora inositola TaxID=47865 RepID=UPI001E5B05AC|nr:hypothetical protein [Micromonospora inositola]